MVEDDKNAKKGMKRGCFVVRRQKSGFYLFDAKIAQNVSLSLFTVCGSYEKAVSRKILLDAFLYV